MDVQEYIDNSKTNTKAERVRDNQRYRKEFKALALHEASLSKLPSCLSYHGYQSWDGRLEFGAYLDNDAEVKETLTEVRRALGIRQSDKQIDRYTGTLTYKTSNDWITVYVHGGSLPKSCKLIATTTTEQVERTRYEMECK